MCGEASIPLCCCSFSFCSAFSCCCYCSSSVGGVACSSYRYCCCYVSSPNCLPCKTCCCRLPHCGCCCFCCWQYWPTAAALRVCPLLLASQQFYIEHWKKQSCCSISLPRAVASPHNTAEGVARLCCTRKQLLFAAADATAEQQQQQHWK